MNSRGKPGFRALDHSLKAATLAVAVSLLLAAPAMASPQWRIDSAANTAAAPGAELEYSVQITDVGDEPIPPATGGNGENCVPGAPSPANPGKCYTVVAQFPAGLTPVKAETFGQADCTISSATIACAYPGDATASQVQAFGGGHYRVLILTAAVDNTASGRLVSSFEVSGGEAGSATVVEPTEVASSPPDFGIDAFDALTNRDEAGLPATAAGTHPFSQFTALDFNTLQGPPPLLGMLTPVEGMRDALVDLPAGLLGNPAVAGRCTAVELDHMSRNNGAGPLCPTDSQVGTVQLRMPPGPASSVGPVPLFSMVPPPGAVAGFGFQYAGTIVVLDATVHQDASGRYVVSVASNQASPALGIAGSETVFWGVPADEAHRPERACSGEGNPFFSGKTCAGAPAPEAFLRMPTSCTAPGQGLPWSLHLDSWEHPGAVDSWGQPDISDPLWKSRTIESHAGPGYPHDPSEWGPPIGVEACDAVPFSPESSLEPTTSAADSPSGLSFALHMPQQGLTDPSPGVVSESDLKAVRVKLPEGVSVNPATADGQAACSAAEIGLLSAPGVAPARFSGAPQTCPDASKIGTVEIKTPLLVEPENPAAQHPLRGPVYLAKQGENPFGSLLALYVVVEDPQTGIVLKLPGRVDVDEQSGRVEAVFDDAPQLPFETLHVDLFGGPRAALRTPAACGQYQTQVTLTPWSGQAPVTFSEPLEVTAGPGGAACPANAFSPKLDAGAVNPLAGSTTPFTLRLSREDGTQEFGGLSVSLPPGLSGYLKGIPYCPDAALAAVSGDLGTGVGQEQSPSCPAASLVGNVVVGAGAGPDPFYTRSGRAYLAGPYKGGPLSLAVITPAVAGPFDLGSVVVRNAIQVDPVTAQLTVQSDPLPTILHGIPLDLRDVRVNVNRDHFMLNPTSCEPMSIASTVVSTRGATATPSNRFQVGGCETLAFKPKLALRLEGQTKRAGFPALRATLTVPQKAAGANISRVQVSLPHSEFVAQSHLLKVCTRVQYAEGGGGGGGCPKKAVYGHARAWSPLLDRPLEGPVYLRSNGGERELPDLVASLGGQIHIDAIGYIGTNKRTQGLRATFATVPDAPVEKIVLTMPAGKHSLLENSTDICRGKRHAIVQMDAHNGKIADSHVPLQVSCKKTKHHGGGARHRP